MGTVEKASKNILEMKTDIKQNISLEGIALRVSIVAMLVYGAFLTVVLLLWAVLKQSSETWKRLTQNHKMAPDEFPGPLDK